ncbi:hypothetical protein [Streptomyces lonarensis]|uniref:Uncharacterized protein n=1 Tax=Streptomyces lonarensis TaxID=700599 RepID=A0A7X6D1N5_9ACTN|nr:hypothetical protein [Streptomyces lonarensis]NJQ06517.1 hypothetical protein [Streptomyces lonarensis]
MRVPVTGEVYVHYSQIYVESEPEGGPPPMDEAFAGQRSGLCGAGVPGALWLTTGLHTGRLGFVVEVHDEEPPLDPDWEEVVEVSFRPQSDRSQLVQWAGEEVWELGLDRTDYRVRYCARGMDEGNRLDTAVDELAPDSYLLQFWPSPPSSGRLIRQTSRYAAARHQYARALPPPPTPEQRAEAERRAREAEEEAEAARQRESERRQWGGQLPRPALRAPGRKIPALVPYDSDLVHTIAACSPGVQRAVARLAARRACEAARLTEVPWIAAALAALAAGRPLPSPFDDAALLDEALRSDPRLPDHRVAPASPPPPAPPPDRHSEPAEKPQRKTPRREAAGQRRTADGSYPASSASADVRERWLLAPSVGPVVHESVIEVSSRPDAAGRIALTDPAARLVSQTHAAVPAVLAAVAQEPLWAALDAVWHAIRTTGPQYPELLAEIRSFCAEQAGA